MDVQNGFHVLPCVNNKFFLSLILSPPAVPAQRGHPLGHIRVSCEDIEKLVAKSQDRLLAVISIT